MADDLKLKLERLESRRMYATALLARGDASHVERAKELLQTALDGYRVLGAPFHADLSERLLADAETVRD